MSNEGKPVAPSMYVTIPLYGIAFILQFLFTYVHISADKSGDALLSLRLTGVSDLVYLVE